MTAPAIPTESMVLPMAWQSAGVVVAAASRSASALGDAAIENELEFPEPAELNAAELREFMERLDNEFSGSDAAGRTPLRPIPFGCFPSTYVSRSF